MTTLDNSTTKAYAVWAVGPAGETLHAVYTSKYRAELEATSCNQEDDHSDYRVAPVIFVGDTLQSLCMDIMYSGDTAPAPAALAFLKDSSSWGSIQLAYNMGKINYNEYSYLLADGNGDDALRNPPVSLETVLSWVANIPGHIRNAE